MIYTIKVIKQGVCIGYICKRMNISSTEHKDAQLEIPKQTILGSHIIFLEYHFEDLLFPYDELEKWKIQLDNMRSRADKFEISRSLARRPANDQPLYEVYKNIMNKNSSSVSTLENSANNKTSVEINQDKTFEKNSKSISINNTNNVKKSDKPLKVEGSNRMKAKETDENSKRSNVTHYSANTNNTFRFKRPELHKRKL